VQQQEDGRAGVRRRFEAMNKAKIAICVQVELSGLSLFPEIVIY
jgi:hypothetical protein